MVVGKNPMLFLPNPGWLLGGNSLFSFNPWLLLWYVFLYIFYQRTRSVFWKPCVYIWRPHFTLGGKEEKWNAFLFFPPFFFLRPYPGHKEVPGLRAEYELQLRPVPQPQQHESQATSSTCTAACSNIGSLTHRGSQSASSQTLGEAFNQLSHSGNSRIFLPLIAGNVLGLNMHFD